MANTSILVLTQSIANTMAESFFVAFSNPESSLSHTIRQIIKDSKHPDKFHISSMHDRDRSSSFLARPPMHASRLYADDTLCTEAYRVTRWNSLTELKRTEYETQLRDMNESYLHKKQIIDRDVYSRDCTFLAQQTTRAAIFELFPKTGFGPDINYMVSIANLIGFIQGINIIRGDQPIRILCVSSHVDYLADHIALNGMPDINSIIIDPDNHHISELADIINSFTQDGIIY